MRVKKLILQNFRCYKEETVIPFAQLTGFIGRNDVGKSTILEALDIFFEDGPVKIESADASKEGDADNVRIGVVFDELPKELILDSNALTSLQEEYLLNEDDDLEIHKVFKCSIQKPSLEIFANAFHPTASDAENILQKSRTDLRQIVRELDLTEDCNQTENPSMRKAIYRSISDLDLKIRMVPLNQDNGKAIWGVLKNYFPIFALFRSDRPSSDQDAEVQNPMKVAIDLALGSLTSKLEEITQEVREESQKTAERTLEKLREINPEIASKLEPSFKKPQWKSIFKLDLETDRGIPLNKRGSGVRRLVLLSFFQAEAEKRRTEKQAGEDPSCKVFYAIEEPETSQHPDSQKQIISALKELSSAGDQVVLTTHVPELAAFMPLEGLRLVEKDLGKNIVRVRGHSVEDESAEELYEKIAKTLGVLPSPLKKDVRVAVLVEGKNDIDALQSMIQVFVQGKKIQELEERRIFWVMGGGDSTLREWVERGNLRKLDIPQVMIQDSDRESENAHVSEQKLNWRKDMNAIPNVKAFLTRKRSMENYFHPNALLKKVKNMTNLPDMDLDFGKVAEELSKHLKEANRNSAQTGFSFNFEDYDGKPITSLGRRACKQIICSDLMRHMTVDEIEKRANYKENGKDKNEVLEWIEAIESYLSPS